MDPTGKLTSEIRIVELTPVGFRDERRNAFSLIQSPGKYGIHAFPYDR
jgi:hypothetical protein